MSKTKMRCITCGKWFQSANAREVTCPDCTQKARKEKLATKNAPPANKVTASGTQGTSAPQAVSSPKPKATKGGTNQWLDNLSDVKVGEPEPPPQRPKIPSPPLQRDQSSNTGSHRYQDQRTSDAKNYSTRPPNRPSGAPPDSADYHTNGGKYTPTMGQRPQGQRQPMGSGANRSSGQGSDKPWVKGPQKPKNRPPKTNRPAAPPRPKREKIPPPEPFKPTEEQIKQVENRYLELAQPVEFDGIRGQIAKELGIPKKAVKKIVKDLRDHQDIPSWWELQPYKGDSEELAKIKGAYEPYLPVPPVGVHKTLAGKLDLKPGIVYQAIKMIRLELNLPQYNDPVLHAQEFALLRSKSSTATEEKEEAHPEDKPAEA